jgi:hypothetical protein
VDTLLKELNAHPDTVVELFAAPETFLVTARAWEIALDVISDFSVPLSGRFLIAFATTLEQVEVIARTVADLAWPDPVIWIAYPKGSSKRFRCEFNRDTGWRAMGTAGYEPVRQIAIDEDWSALRFRRVAFIKTMTRGFAMTDEGKAKTTKPN